jgi:NitT/TauT family transport system substrate-binding protein
MKRQMALRSAALLACLILSRQDAWALDKVIIGFSSLSAVHGATWVAEEKGLFKKYGLDPQIVIMPGTAVGISALMAGDVQFLNAGGNIIIGANLKGADLVMLGAYINKGVQSIMARADIKTPNDLRGKSVGVTRLYDGGHRLLERALGIWKINTADVKLIALGSSPAMLARLEKGGIDAAVLTIPSVFVAEDKGFRAVANFSDMGLYSLSGMLSTRRAFLRANRELATRFMKGFVEGIAYFNRNKKESIAVLGKKLRTGPESDKYLERAYDLLATKQYERVPTPSPVGLKTVMEFFALDDPKAKGVDPTSFIDGSILKELEESGFIKSLYER